ncbi:MAG: hypothetical protein Q7S31_01055 [bacterium]|nr:hypothetical protein [bacterium]
MSKYSNSVRNKVRQLRSQGKTYGEIQGLIGRRFPKSTLSEWCKYTSLPTDHWERISKLNISNLEKARKLGVEMNLLKRSRMFKEFENTNTPIALTISNKKTAKIALAMLCLGEASKSGGKSAFCLGSSDQRIITLFLKLLQVCFKEFDFRKIRCTVQCRADQDTETLETYWQKITKTPPSQFYKTRIDPRTKGKPTLKNDYKGVLRVDYLNAKTRLELESLADLIYNYVAGPVV